MLKNKKFIIIFVLACLVLEIIVLMPTFSRLLNPSSNTIVEWDKTVANFFHGGTGSIDDPYIISNAKELAYFGKALENNSFEDEYIKLSNDIIINKGFFKYDEDYLYIVDDNNYYLDIETSNYYQEKEFENLVGTVNEFMKLDNFKGHFDGDFHRIYGLYLNDDNISLFTNLSGEIANLIIDNALVYGTYEASGVVLNANNASIKNIIFNGNVVGSNNAFENNITNTIDDINVDGEYTLNLDLPLVTSANYTFTLSGNCTSSSETFTINDKEVACTNFNEEVNPYNITITGNNLVLSNLEYTLTYSTSLSSGIVSRSYNSVIDGIVNKGKISNINASGLVGINYNSNISNSYNLGNIYGNNTSGIVDTVLSSDITLKNVYNNGSLENSGSGFITNILNSNIEFINSFNNSNTTSISNISSSNINVTNSYNFYSDNGFNELDLTTINSLYGEYDIDTIQEGNVWIYNELPTLYFDDNYSNYVNIKVDNYSWNKYHNTLDEVDFYDDISILLTSKDDYRPIKQVYYYVGNSILDKTELDSLEWNTYNGIITINETGSYVLYVKVVDYNDNYYYLNTDILVLGSLESIVSLNTLNYSWNNYHNVDNIYTSNNLEYSLIINSSNSGISDIKYLVSSQELSTTELDNIIEWNIYNDKINVINDNYILYIKLTSISGKVTYINSDRFIYKMYYIDNIKSGNNITFNSNMSYNSSFNFNVLLNHNLLSSGIKRYVRSNNILPVGTEILLKDLDSKIVYKYVVDNNNFVYNGELSGYLYAFDQFKEVGKYNVNTYFDDSSYTSKDIESFNINISFKDVEATTNSYLISVVGIGDNAYINTDNGVLINLYDVDTNINNYLNISSSYDGSEFVYNETISRSIPISLSLSDLIGNEVSVLNTNYENMHLGVAIEVVDSNSNILDSSYYSGIKFKYNNKTYTPNSSNVTLIDLGTEYNQNVLIDIVGNMDNSSYINGTYSIKITSYLSINGRIKKYNSNNYISIPLVFNKDYTKLNYSFNVSLPQGLIINKLNNNIVNFNIVESAELTNPNVRVSLYKKKELTAYDQDYVLVDLNDYIKNKLESADSNIYYALKTPISYDVNETVNSFSVILNDDIESNGYMFKFGLYDGDNLVGEVNLKVIVR